MNNFKTKQAMRIIMVITIVISTIVLTSSLLFRSYSPPYTTYNNYEILYEGEIIEITYWNVTVERVNMDYLNYEIENYTYRLCNLTILNASSNTEEKLTFYAYYFIDNEVEIGDTVIFYHSYGTIWDIKIIKKGSD